MEKLFGQFDPELLERLARILRDNDLGELTLEDGDKKLTIKGKKPAPMPAPMGMPPVYPPAAPQEDAPTAPAESSSVRIPFFDNGKCILPVLQPVLISPEITLLHCFRILKIKNQIHRVCIVQRE